MRNEYLNYNYEWSINAITIWDYILLPVYILIILFISNIIRKRIQTKRNEAKYFIPGLLIKVAGGIGVCIIYIYYYGWGDTVDYYYGTSDLINLMFSKPDVFLKVLSGDLSAENFSRFPVHHDWAYIYRDPNSYAVVRFSVLFSLLGFNYYILTTIILATFSFVGVWKIFTLFCDEFGEIKSQLAFAILFIPSVAFWGSGFLKDTYTLASTCLLIYCSYSLLLKKRYAPKIIFVILVCSYILISIRPFMFYIVLDSLVIMLTYGYLSKVKSVFLKSLSFILIVLFLWGGGVALFMYIGSKVKGHYGSVDSMINTAVVIQEDLKREAYGPNSFDIGKIEPTVAGVLSKAPVAINAGLFYPYLWKARNPVMIVAGLENLLVLLLSLYVLLLMIVAASRYGFKYMLKTTFDHPLIVFSVVYFLQYAFMVGLTTANYGALVRYKIPLLPFFAVTLFIIIHKFNVENRKITEHSKSNAIKEFGQ